ncbi:aminotransferase class V-fold PLP-dependent enzyme [Mycoplasma sp. 2704]|uniref:aminotransferase class V-fold PLP-dependent enzyme n=1 Tax=Mycoplasma sp. 2704 TaxID=3108529 RepID=UPI002B1D24E1|nr:aminotransferase class V-fold PLP-dependent enzyme [Mycoplasma sp. 2704]MEA4134385.1 aminotransferase class V-fold PLP-dependent enzyme [Mycoplasma sp. 2704]
MKNKEIREQFPILKSIVYFDSAALVLKPQTAVDALVDFYSNKSISSRTADTPIGSEVNQTISRVRSKVADLINAKETEVIFTSGTTESINMFAQMMGQILKDGDEILLSSYNHSSNIIPWLEIAKKTNSKVVMSNDILSDINEKTKLISFSNETNNFNISLDINAICKIAKEKNIVILADAAQAISHKKTSLNDFDAIAFSTNKFYGPTGMGVLAIKDTLLSQFRPVKFGGGSVDAIGKDNNWTIKKTISRFEPGTPDLGGFFMFDKSLDFFNSIGYEKTQEILKDLSTYLHNQLATLDNIEVFSKPGDNIALINVKEINPQDVATYLGSKGIYTIAGIFCAPYLRNIQDNYSFLRISLGIYNSYEDIDKLIEELKNGGDFYAF